MVGDRTDDLQSHIDDILDILSENATKKVEREELEKEFQKFLEYGVPVDQAKQSLIKKYGGSSETKTPISHERILIVDLKPNLSSVHLLGRVITINEKEITVRGEKRKIFYGILGDESGTIPFTAWTDFAIGKGDVLEVSNAYTREWQSTVQVNFGDRTTIQKTDSQKLSESNYEPKGYTLKELRSGLGSIDVTAKILDVTEREVTVEGKKKKVFSGIIADETGKAQYTAWHDFKLKEGHVIRIKGGYVKTWKGVPQLTFDEKATVEKLDADTISKKDITTQKIPLHELVEKGGALDVQIEGTIIEIREGSGLVSRCPECNRVLQDNACSIHGKVTGVPDFRVKIVVDDGTGTVNGLLGQEAIKELLGKTLDDWTKLAAKDNALVMMELFDHLFAHRVILQGNALGDQFGTTIIVKKASRADLDVSKEAEKLREELGGFA